VTTSCTDTYIGIREHIGNRSAYGQQDGPKTNVPIISGNCGWQGLALWLEDVPSPHLVTNLALSLSLPFLFYMIDDRV